MHGPIVRRRCVSLAAVGAAGHHDATSNVVLDAGEQLLRRYGLHRWTMADVADVAHLGRTTVYRSFANRDDLVHAVLARELHQTLAAIAGAVEAETSIEDKVVAAAVVGLRALNGSVVDQLLHSDPATFLPFLTTDAGPLLAIARTSLASQVRAFDPAIDPRLAEEVGEAAARLGLSFILTRDSVVPLDDPVAARQSVRRLLQPLLTTLRA